MKPGVHVMDPREYHRDRSALSSTWARKLLPPKGTAAKFHYQWLHGETERSDDMDFGAAAHQVVLGRGSEIKIIDFPDWRKKDAQNAKKDAHAAGQIPLLTDDMQTVEEMAHALREHAIAGPLLEPGTGQAEVALYWEDTRILAERGEVVMRKCLLDWFSHRRSTRTGHLYIPEYKTTDCAERGAFMRSAKTHGYPIQAAWNMAGYRALGIDEDPIFLWIAQEKTPPYLVNVIEPDPDTLMWGRELGDHALNIFRKCRAEGVWPGYSDDIQLGSLPPYADRDYEETLTYLDDFVTRPDGTLPI